jgi:hypothetical protein
MNQLSDLQLMLYESRDALFLYSSRNREPFPVVSENSSCRFREPFPVLPESDFMFLCRRAILFQWTVKAPETKNQ